MNKKEFVCIACPNSCKLTVWEEGGEIHVDGYACKRGIDHGKNEYTNPMRMLTTTVAIEGGHHRRLSVSGTGIKRQRFLRINSCTVARDTRSTDKRYSQFSIRLVIFYVALSFDVFTFI